jgi:hypothetical protein
MKRSPLSVRLAVALAACAASLRLPLPAAQPAPIVFLGAPEIEL